MGVHPARKSDRAYRYRRTWYSVDFPSKADPMPRWVTGALAISPKESNNPILNPTPFNLPPVGTYIELQIKKVNILNQAKKVNILSLKIHLLHVCTTSCGYKTFSPSPLLFPTSYTYENKQVTDGGYFLLNSKHNSPKGMHTPKSYQDLRIV